MVRITLSVLLALLCTGAASNDSTPRIADPATSPLSSASNGLAPEARRTAGTDTFILYGGPGTLEGKFELANGKPDWQGWEGADRTDEINYWQVSTYNAENLGGHGAGNHAYWCGRTAEQAPYWGTPPGYGSNWNTSIEYLSNPVADPSVGQTVSIDFYFNIDSEPGYDFLTVEIERGGIWVPLVPTHAIDGTNRDVNDAFPAPGLLFSDVGQSTFNYFGNDYGGEDGDRIRIRLRFRSDGAIDDQSGLWPTVAGATQVDDVTITHDAGTFFEDFEGAGPYLLTQVEEPFVGDFSDLFLAIEDLDPYYGNSSGVATFIDYGQDVRNGPDPSGATSTGGSTSPNWSYGLDGGHVVNYTGGLTAGPGALEIQNEIWSPWITWDLPGTEDDDPEVVGAILSFDVYNHVLVSNGIFLYWAVGPRGGNAVMDPYILHYSQNGPLWERFDVDVTEFLDPDRNPQVRIALGVRDYAALFGFPGGDMTPAPYFDNVRLVKYRLDGLRLASGSTGMILSGLPQGPNLDVSTPAGRDLLNVPLFGEVEVDRFIDGQAVADVRVVWALQRNPLFEDEIRTLPATSLDENIVTGPGVWTGERLPSSSYLWSPVDFSDLLQDCFYPGDRLEYYVRATDTDGRITTLPADLTGFGNFDGSYHPRFSIRGLPTIADATGTQPEILVYVGGRNLADVDLIIASMRQSGMIEGVDFDVYLPGQNLNDRPLGVVTSAPVLGNYETILVFGGGSDDYAYKEWPLWLQANYAHNRLGLDEETLVDLIDWTDLPGDRNLVLFGSIIGYSLANGQFSAPGFLENELGVQLIGNELRPEIGNQNSPGVAALGSGFTGSFVVSGNAREYLALDHVEPIAPAVRAHAFELAGGGQHATAAASIFKVESVGPDTKVNLTFPYPFRFISDGANRGTSSRVQLLEQIFAALGTAAPSGPPVSSPAVRKARMAVAPNPFNPRTTVSLALPKSGEVTIQVFDSRGRLVRTLHRGGLRAGPHDFEWDGTDGTGTSVASGVYLVKARHQGGTLTRKVAMVK